MNYFQFFSHDQEQFNWLIFDAHRDPPYLTVKPRYSQHVCPKCIKIDHDRVFEEGFEEGLRIRAKGDFFGSDEGFECVSDSVLRVVEQSGFAGLAFKPIPGTKWHVMNLRRQVDADKNAYKYSKGVCEVCKRPKEITGLIKFLSQIKVPDEPRTLFGPTFDRGGLYERRSRPFRHRRHCFAIEGAKDQGWHVSEAANDGGGIVVQGSRRKSSAIQMAKRLQGHSVECPGCPCYGGHRLNSNWYGPTMPRSARGTRLDSPVIRVWPKHDARSSQSRRQLR